MLKNFPIFDRLFLGEKNSYNNESFINVRKTSCRGSELLFWIKRFGKIPHLRGFISLEKFFRKKLKNFPIFNRLFLGEKNSYNNESFINVRKTSCRGSELLFWIKRFEKISHLRGFISLEKFFRKKLKNFPIFNRLFLGEKNSYNNESFINVRKTSCRGSELLFWIKRFEKISHLRGFISLEKFFRKKVEKFSNFWSPISRWKKLYNNEIVSNVHKTCCPVG